MATVKTSTRKRLIPVLITFVFALTALLALFPLTAVKACASGVDAANEAELRLYLESITPRVITITANGINLTDSIVLGAAHEIINASGNTVAISGRIFGFGSLTKSGTGILLLSGSNTYSGTTTVNGGTLSALNIPNNLSVTNGTVTVSSTIGGTVSHTGGTINGHAINGTPCACPFCRTPVRSIIGVPSSATAGTPLILTGTVLPSNATNKAIEWSVLNAGTTGATIKDSILSTTMPGTVTVTATIPNGTASGNFTESFNIIITAPFFTPVTGITDVPTAATARTPLTLTATVTPAIATNKTIVWSVMNAGTTGATITSGNIFNAAAEGTATIRATITGGLSTGNNYTQTFNITVAPAPFVAVADITGVPSIKATRTPLTLAGTLVPSDPAATYTTANQITWSVQDAGGTGATITNGNRLNTTAAGTVVVRATVVGGASATADFTKDFTITVNSDGLMNPLDTDVNKKLITDTAVKNDGSDIKIAMGTYTEIPSDTLKLIQGMNVNLVLDFGAGGTVSLNGRDVPEALSAGSLEIGLQNRLPSSAITGYNIPQAAVDAKAANLTVRKIKLGSGDAVNIGGTVTITISSSHAGQNIILTSYNAAFGNLEFVSGGKIAADGSAEVNFSATGDYLVIIQKTGDITGTGEVSTDDAIEVLRAVAGLTTLDSIQRYVVNGGKPDELDVDDALNILRLVAGVIDRI